MSTTTGAPQGVEAFYAKVTNVSDFIWGGTWDGAQVLPFPPMVVILLGVGLWMMIGLRFYPLLKLGEAFAGQGYMSAGVRAVIPYAFGVLGFRRVEAACVPQNAASVGLLERVGFTREGLARQYLCINGTWTDHALYAFVQGDRLG